MGVLQAIRIFVNAALGKSLLAGAFLLQRPVLTGWDGYKAVNNARRRVATFCQVAYLDTASILQVILIPPCPKAC